MTPAYKVLICKCATGHVMNADAKTVFSRPALEVVKTPIIYSYLTPLRKPDSAPESSIGPTQS